MLEPGRYTGDGVMSGSESMLNRQDLSIINAIREKNKLLYGTKGLPQI